MASRGPDLDQFRTQFGQWVYGNSTDLITSRFRTFVTADVAVQLYTKNNDRVAGLVIVDWIPGELDGSRGIGETTIREHIKTIEHRRLVNAPDTVFPPLSTNPSYGYCGTDPHWFMRKHADTSHVRNTLGTYSVPTEATIVKGWLGWNSFAGAQLVNPYPPSQFYLAASNRSIFQRGQYGPSTYDKTRNIGWNYVNGNKVINSDDVTSFHPGQHNWDITNLPAILYQLHPTAVDQHPQNWPKPPQMRDVDGNPMFDPADPAFPILDWTILPFHISTQEDPCVMATWLRLDPRMSWKDIIARMVLDGRPIPNVLNMRVSRLNASLDILPWRDSRKSRQKIENEIENGKRKPLTIFHTLFNTTRGLTPGWNWSEFEKHVPITALKWVEFKGRLAHLNSSTDMVGWKYKPDVDDEKLVESEIYEIWYQYPATAYIDKTGQGLPHHISRRGRPTIPRALAPVQAAVMPGINHSTRETHPCKRRRSLSQEGQPSKKQRNTLSAAAPDMINIETHVDLPVLEHNCDSSADTVGHGQFTEEVVPANTPVSSYFPVHNQFERITNSNWSERGPESVYAEIFDQSCQSTGLDDYGLYTERNLLETESNINNIVDEPEYCIAQLSQELTFDADFASRKQDMLVNDDNMERNPAAYPLESDPQIPIPTKEYNHNDPVLLDYATLSTDWTYATQSVEFEEGDVGINNNLILDEKNFLYIADERIVDWIDTHPDDPKEYIHALVLQFAPHDLYYMCCCTTEQYAM